MAFAYFSSASSVLRSDLLKTALLNRSFFEGQQLPFVVYLFCTTKMVLRGHVNKNRHVTDKDRLSARLLRAILLDSPPLCTTTPPWWILSSPLIKKRGRIPQVIARILLVEQGGVTGVWTEHINSSIYGEVPQYTHINISIPTHTYTSIYWLQRMQDSLNNKMHLWMVNTAPLLVWCELYAQYQVAILIFCTEKSLF